MTLKIDERKLKIMMAREGIDTMERMAELAKVSTKTLYNYCQGEPFRSSVVDRLAWSLNCSPLDLLTTDDDVLPHMDAQAMAVMENVEPQP